MDLRICGLQQEGMDVQKNLLCTRWDLRDLIFVTDCTLDLDPDLVQGVWELMIEYMEDMKDSESQIEKDLTVNLGDLGMSMDQRELNIIFPRMVMVVGQKDWKDQKGSSLVQVQLSTSASGCLTFNSFELALRTG